MRGGRRPRQSCHASESPLPEAFNACPIRTSYCTLDNEREIKCYKLGKKRWSYNQCALVIQNAASGESTEVVDCMQYGPNPLTHDEQESGVTYQVRLANGLRVRVNVFAVYNHPREVEREDGVIEYEWPLLSRRACPKEHCEGPILRTIQRFGKLGRRSGKGNENTMKDTKYMFISIDEAGSHIRVKHFRLVAAMFPIGENVPLSTCISGPIRVLANNDVPSGAAFIPLVLETEPDWDGWRACADLQPRMPEGMHTECGADYSVSLSSIDTELMTSRTVGSGACPTVKEEALEYPIGDLLKQHASEYCQDLDLGASRFMDANNRLEGDASGPAPSEGDSKLTLQVDEETLAYHDMKLASEGYTPVTYSLSANACTYNSPGLSNRSAHDTIFMTAPMAGTDSHNSAPGGLPTYLTFPQIPLLPNAFQNHIPDESELALEDWYDPTLGEQHLSDTTFLFPPCAPNLGHLHY